MATATDIRALLEGYGIDSTVLTDQWLTDRINKFVVPWVEKKTRNSFSAIKQVKEYYSGTGSHLIVLNRKPVVELIAIEIVSTFLPPQTININAVDLIQDEGMLRSRASLDDYQYSYTFPRGLKNLRITYTYGMITIPDDINEAIMYLTACTALAFLADRTGGGNSLNVVSWSRAWGEKGRYTAIRNDLNGMAMAIIKTYATGVVGG
jgi:hypothetical protein